MTHRAGNMSKVETIGDAYMAVGNLSVPQVDHAARVAMFAMDAVKAAKRTLSTYLKVGCLCLVHFR